MLYARQWELHPALPYVAEWTTTTRLATQMQRWRTLAEAAVEPNPFYEPEFLLASATHIEKAEIRCIAIYADSTHDSDLIGLFPLKRAQIMPGLPLPALQLYRNIYCTLTAPLIAGPDPAGVWRCFLDAVARTEGASRIVLAPCLPSARATYGALETALATSDRTMEIVDRHSRASVQNVTSFARYTEQYGTKRNKDIRRRERRLHELGTVEMRTVSDPEGKRAALADFLRIEAAGWKGAEGSAMACSPASKALAEAVFLADCAEFDVLSINGKAITVNANLLRNGVLFTMKTAYDEDFHQYSPGIMLDLHDVRNLANHPARYTRIDSLAIPGHPIESRWCEKEEIASLVIDTTEHAGPAHARTMAGVLRGIGQIKSWVKEQIAARKP